MVLKCGQFEKIRNTWKILNCGAQEDGECQLDISCEK